MLLQDVKVITLKKGEFTTARRVPSLPQLQCSGGLGCIGGTYDVSSVQCVNTGWDGLDVNWKCMTDLPHGTSFGLVEVSCEGYEYPEDPFVLAGSCQLRYNLRGNPAGEEKEGSSFAFICAAVGLCWVFYCVCHPRVATAQPAARAGFFSGLVLGATGAHLARGRRRRGGGGWGRRASAASGRRTYSKYKATGYARTKRR